MEEIWNSSTIFIDFSYFIIHKKGSVAKLLLSRGRCSFLLGINKNNRKRCKRQIQADILLVNDKHARKRQLPEMKHENKIKQYQWL